MEMMVCCFVHYKKSIMSRNLDLMGGVIHRWQLAKSSRRRMQNLVTWCSHTFLFIKIHASVPSTIYFPKYFEDWMAIVKCKVTLKHNIGN